MKENVVTKRTCYSSNPAVRIMSLYGYPCRPQVDVIPYSVNILAQDLVRSINYRDLVKEYIIWYLSHLNKTDIHGLSGTIYDLTVDENGDEHWRETYDSADAYGGTFLLLVSLYYKYTGDSELLESYKRRLEDVAYMIVSLQDEDGLTWVWRGSSTKYLMDNCEAYAGLKAYARLKKELGWKHRREYQEAAKGIKDGILSELFDPEGLLFNWGMEKGGETYEADWDNFYPDALAQIYPIAFGVIAPDTPLARHLWREFSYRYNEWDTHSPVQRLIYKRAASLMEEQ